MKTKNSHTDDVRGVTGNANLSVWQQTYPLVYSAKVFCLNPVHKYIYSKAELL
jgi:hypothetical protein